jgi:hypothetical protein
MQVSVEITRASIGNWFGTAFGACGRTAPIAGAFALGWWLWPEGFLYGPIATIALKNVFLAAGSLSVLAVACLMTLFAAAEPAAALLKRLQESHDRFFWRS